MVVCGLLFLIQFRPKFGPIPDQLLFYRLCLTLVALPFSCRGGGRAERVKFAVPRRGAGVLNPVRTPYRSPGELASPYLSAGPAETVELFRGTRTAAFFGFFSVFSVLKKTEEKKRTIKKSTFSAEFDDFRVSDVDVLLCLSQNGSPEVVFSVFF